MPILPNTRHEAFAQELAKGQSADEAYALAGFEPNRGNACRLKANESISERVKELQALSAEGTGATIAGLTAELEAARLLAMGSPTGASAAVAAIMGKAKLQGLLVDRSETVNHNYTISDEPMSEADWQAQYATEH